MRTLIPLAGLAAILLAVGANGPVSAKASSTAVAQANEPMTRQQNDERMTDCSRYKNAYTRLDKIHAELVRLQLAFSPTDDIRPKLDGMITQANDIMSTARSRVDRCPAERE